MKTRKSYNPCFCTFVPPYILDRLSKASDGVIDEKTRQAAQASLTQDNQMRAKRAAQAADTQKPGDIIEESWRPQWELQAGKCSPATVNGGNLLRSR